MSKWYDSDRRALWFLILFAEDRLGWKEDFLEAVRVKNKLYKDFINESLLSAARSMRLSITGELGVISQLLHVASSVVLLESDRGRVDVTLSFIRETDPFQEIDPSVVLTSVALYYLICSAEHDFKTDAANLELIRHIHSRLNQMNWFIGVDAMKKLGFRF